MPWPEASLQQYTLYTPTHAGNAHFRCIWAGNDVSKLTSPRLLEGQTHRASSTTTHTGLVHHSGWKPQRWEATIVGSTCHCSASMLPRPVPLHAHQALCTRVHRHVHHVLAASHARKGRRQAQHTQRHSCRHTVYTQSCLICRPPPPSTAAHNPVRCTVLQSPSSHPKSPFHAYLPLTHIWPSHNICGI
jgi:hypothetical protein